jgi:hypothetical protein
MLGIGFEVAGEPSRPVAWNLSQVPDRLDRATAWLIVGNRTSRGIEGVLTVLPIVFLPVETKLGKARTRFKREHPLPSSDLGQSRWAASPSLQLETRVCSHFTLICPR